MSIKKIKSIPIGSNANKIKQKDIYLIKRKEPLNRDLNWINIETHKTKDWKKTIKPLQ